MDVKDANIMVMMRAHRFGLSHRFISCGAVGRNTSRILLFIKQYKGSGFPAALENLRTDKRWLCDSRADLQLRNPGDILRTDKAVYRALFWEM